MAGIDKLHLKSWYTFDELVRWSICHYPELLNYMYDWRISYKDWEKAMKASIKMTKKINARDLEKIGGKDVSLRTATYNLIDYYRKEADYECSYDQAKYEAESILNIANKSDIEFEDDYFRPVMNTSCKIDRKLLWICPIKEVRDYLHEQCGYSRRWEWLYKIFWKGKYEFTY